VRERASLGCSESLLIPSVVVGTSLCERSGTVVVVLGGLFLEDLGTADAVGFESARAE
jgi:hypothetical protein